ncbi:unnamed protein product, partial [marine sediment metagenome]
MTTADYARAEKVLDARLGNAILNARVAAQWIGEEPRFWYRRDGADGAEYILVDAERATRAPLFDRERLDKAIASAKNAPGLPEGGLDIDRVERADGRLRVTLKPIDGRVVHCDVATYSCVAENAA